MKKINLIMIIVALTMSAVYGQGFISSVSKRGTAAAPFLSIPQGARAISMGGAFVGVANDASAIYWNPAGITDVASGNFLFDHTDWIADIKYYFLAGAYNIEGFGVLGFSLTSSDIGDMKVTTIDEPNGTGEIFTATDVAFSVAYALQLTDRFSIGFNPKFIFQSIWRMNASAFAIDMGVKYITPFDNAVLAMSVSNFGTKMQLVGNSNLVLHDLDPRSTGNNGKIPAYLETDEWALPLSFRVGVAYNAFKDDFNQLTVALDAVHPSDNYESVDVGAEYAYDNFIFVRGGYRSLFLTDSEEGLTFGLGVRQNLMNNLSFVFDYAYQEFGRLKNVQKISFGINF